MVVMAVSEREAFGGFTHADLDAIPEDGNRYELLDGMLLVSPAPRLGHQRVIGNLYLVMRAACPADFEVFLSPVDWRPWEGTSLQPDLVVLRRGSVSASDPAVTQPDIALAVEVLSPSTRRKDQMLKRSAYEDAGVKAYWMIDPDPTTPSLVALELDHGVYREVARAAGGEVAGLGHPFPVTVAPADLVL